MADGVFLAADADQTPDTDGRRQEAGGGQWNFDHDNRKPWCGQPAERATRAACMITPPYGQPSSLLASIAPAIPRPTNYLGR
ncbi:cryptochrome/photolyase family protein [Rugamonas sp.]|uniref:cryptochrome/photolyase family protein n=1 Tax=Rugamonas sp. TaxID=1926287 RepID=UPI00345B707E